MHRNNKLALSRNACKRRVTSTINGRSTRRSTRDRNEKMPAPPFRASKSQVHQDPEREGRTLRLRRITRPKSPIESKTSVRGSGTETTCVGGVGAGQ